MGARQQPRPTSHSAKCEATAGEGDAALGHHFDEISIAQPIRQVPAHTELNDFLTGICDPGRSDLARRLLGRSRRPPIRGHTSSVPRHGLRGVGCLKQLPKPVCQQFDGLPQGAELPNPDYRDGSVQVKRWGTQDFHGIDRMIPGNKASG